MTEINASSEVNSPPVDGERRRLLNLLSALAGTTWATAACGGGAGEVVAAPVASPAPSTPPPSAPPPSPAAPAPGPAPAATGVGRRGFTLTSAVAGTVPFTLGLALKQGELPAGRALVASTSRSQAIIKNTWPDGSGKFAIISGQASLEAATPLTVSLVATSAAGVPARALTTADLRATSATAEVACGAFGAVTWAGADWESPFATWVTGPEMSSWLYRKVIGVDPHLVAWLEVRLFSTGAVEVLPWIENGYLTVPAPSSKRAVYSFALGGLQRFSAEIDLANHTRTPLLSGTALSWWLGADPGVVVRHDTAYLQSTGLVPTYSAAVAPNAPVVGTLPPSYVPLQQGNYSPGMGAPGYHGSIGLLPEWDVLYLTCTAPQIWAALQRNAYSAGRFGIHFRDQTSHWPLRISQHASLVLDGSSGVSATGASTSNTYTPAASGTVPAAYTNTHAPALGFMAYLVTGRPYHLQTLQFQATLNFLKNGNAQRGAGGIFKSNVGANTTRGAAWSLRSLAQAAAISPDGDELTNEFVSSLRANIDYYHGRYVAQTNNPLGMVTPYTDYTPAVVAKTLAGSTPTGIVWPSGYVFTSDGYYNGWQIEIAGETRSVIAYSGASRTATVDRAFNVETRGVQAELRSDNTCFAATWQQDFFTAALGYAKALGVHLGADTQIKLDALFAWKAQSAIGRLGGTGAQDYLYRDAAPYTIAIAPDNFPDFEGGTGPWFADWGQAYEATYAPGGPNASPSDRLGGGLRGGNYPAASSYWGNLQPAIAYAVEHGVAGASEAYARMTSASNWDALQRNFDGTPVWSVRPR